MTQYNILDHVSVLTKSKGSKTKYHCPVCNGDDLDIQPANGKYQCFSGGCSLNDIRVAIDRLEGKPEYDPRSKGEQAPWKKPIRAAATITYYYPDRQGNDLVKVMRKDDGQGGKKFSQYHWDGSKWLATNPKEIKVQIPIYRYAEVLQAILDGSQVWIVEGENAVNKLWDLGIPATTTIGGSSGFTNYGEYTQDFKSGRFVLAPDCDAKGIEYIGKFAAILGDRVAGYYLAGNESNWSSPCGGFDIVDDIASGLDVAGILGKVIDSARYLVAIASKPKQPVGRPKSARKSSVAGESRDYRAIAAEMDLMMGDTALDGDGVPVSKLVKLELDLFAVFGDRLRFNEMTREIELDGDLVDLNLVKSLVARAVSYDASSENCIISLTQLAMKHTYHPVKSYLESLRGKGSKEFIRDMPARYWGNTDEFQNKLFYKKMIAAVARALSPGCKDDSLLILAGGQGAMKSTALKVLTGNDWFTDDLRSVDDKDELAKLSKFWILELAEVDYLFGKKETEVFKRFLSAQKDTFRPPYGRMNVTIQRSSALFATTNKTEFLTDPTGARRYWVVNVDQLIDVAAIKRDRDLLWSAAVAAYDDGETWHLADGDILIHESANQSYQEYDPWHEDIVSGIEFVTEFAGSTQFVTIDKIIQRTLQIDIDKKDQRTSRRIAAILRLLGYTNKLVYTSPSKQSKVWAKIDKLELKPETNLSFENSGLSQSGSSSTLKPTNLTNSTISKIINNSILINGDLGDEGNQDNLIKFSPSMETQVAPSLNPDVQEPESLQDNDLSLKPDPSLDLSLIAKTADRLKKSFEYHDIYRLNTIHNDTDLSIIALAIDSLDEPLQSQVRKMIKKEGL